MSAVESLFELAPELQETMKPGPGYVMICCPFHGEKTPSCAVSLEKPVFFCFAGDTRVITKAGTKPIAALAGATHEVLVPGGCWVPAPIKCFGKQTIYEVVVSRNSVKKTIRTTAEHRWFLHKQGIQRETEVVTTGLKRGDTLASCFTPSLAACVAGGQRMAPSPFGIARGFVYGDGTRVPGSAGSLAYTFPEKAVDMCRWFSGCEYYEDAEKITFTGLPTYFKTEMPPLEESVCYLYGWLAGYFAADGDVSEDGTVNLNSAKRADLEYVRDLCTRVGIATFGIKTYLRQGYGTEKSEIHRLGFISDTLPPDFFLRAEHRRRFEAVKKAYSRRRWVVVSVIKTKRIEPVYCAVVPEKHAFTLEDNIKTGNCHGCKISGHIAQLLRHFGMSSTSIDIILPRGEVYQKETVASKIRKGVDLYRGEFVLNELLLDEYRLCPTSLLQAGFAKETLRHFEVGYDTRNARITYPLRNVYGDLVGISGRTIYEDPNFEGSRYKIYDRELKERADFDVPESYTMQEVKSAILWHGHVVRPILLRDHKSPFMAITEGFKACMWTWQSCYQDVVALVGSYMTDTHAELIACAVPKVVLFLDNNEAGFKGTHSAAQKLGKKGVEARVARYPDEREQPDALVPDEIFEALDDSLSYRDWLVTHPVDRPLKFYSHTRYTHQEKT